MKKFLMILGLTGIANVYANSLTIERCFNIAADRYQIPNKLLKAIAITETKMDPYAIGKNANRTYDIGLMQINSSWLPKLSRVGVKQSDLLDPCTNIQIGAWILSDNIKRYGFGLKAIGAYNAVSNDKQQIYAQKVMKNMKLL